MILFLLITSDSLLFNKQYAPAFITLYKIRSSKINSNKYIFFLKGNHYRLNGLFITDVNIDRSR